MRQIMKVVQRVGKFSQAALSIFNWIYKLSDFMGIFTELQFPHGKCSLGLQLYSHLQFCALVVLPQPWHFLWANSSAFSAPEHYCFWEWLGMSSCKAPKLGKKMTRLWLGVGYRAAGSFCSASFAGQTPRSNAPWHLIHLKQGQNQIFLRMSFLKAHHIPLCWLVIP